MVHDFSIGYTYFSFYIAPGIYRGTIAWNAINAEHRNMDFEHFNNTKANLVKCYLVNQLIVLYYSSILVRYKTLSHLIEDLYSFILFILYKF